MLVRFSLLEDKLAPCCPRAFCPREVSVRDRGCCFTGTGDTGQRLCHGPTEVPPDLHRSGEGGGRWAAPSPKSRIPGYPRIRMLWNLVAGMLWNFVAGMLLPV